MTDHQIALWTFGLTGLAAVGTWLAVPQLRPAWLKRKEQSEPFVSLKLDGAVPSPQTMPPGIAIAAERTLAEIVKALPESSMEWLHTKDFGNSFRWRSIEFLETFAAQPQAPTREFLDGELEALRINLVTAAKNCVFLAAAYTDDIHPAGNEDIRKIRDQEDERGNYSDRLFFEKRDEINDAAEATWKAYQKLLRQARLKLAHSHTEGVSR